MQYDIIDVDPAVSAENGVVDSVEQQENSNVRENGRCRIRRNDPRQSSSFKRQARLSAILQGDDSSSDDENLYSISPRSVTFSRPPSEVLQSVSPRHERSTCAAAPNDRNSGPNRECYEAKDETVSMQLSSVIVNSDVGIEMKSSLKTVEVRRESRKSTSGVSNEPTPAKLWEMRKKRQAEKDLLNKTQVSKIKAGWKVRQCLANLPDGEDVNTFYLTIVKRGKLREVDALISLAKVTRNDVFSDFDKNYIDGDDKSALTIAIDNQDESMLRKLLENGLDLGLSIFHAIEADFMEGLKLILAYSPCTRLRIKGENHHFKIGVTPMLLAAHNNNYYMLSLLYEYGHRLTELKDWSDGVQVAWESSNERRMICLAMAQPAYITLTSEIYRMNPMKYCLKEIKRIRTYASQEHEFSSFYEDLRSKYENYMCSLLDFICSSDELADLFQFDRPPTKMNKNMRISSFVAGAKAQRSKFCNCFQLLEKASREKLVKFVTHQQSQLALSHLRYRALPLLRYRSVAYAFGIMFPILSLFYICAPKSSLAGIITLPVVSFHCHMISDVVFAILLLLQIVLKSTEIDRLGQPLTALEWLILLWIIGKWVEEFQECVSRGMKAYIRDSWNYTDLTLLSLFSAGMSIRIYDAVYNANMGRISRYQWRSFEPRLIGEGLQAWGYVFVFIRIMGLTRVDRSLGPLQISLGKMLGDVIRFLFLFALVLGAFAFGLSDLYWYYGTAEGARLFCSDNATNQGISATRNCSITTQRAFTTIPLAMVDLFWALFGMFDRTTMSLGGRHVYTEYIGRTLVATYHIVAIIVMLNMLIAMMSKSYEDTSENEETAWKFHRTSVWIRYIRREVVCPPPMNLIPNPWQIKENMWRVKKCFRSLRCRKKHLTEVVHDTHGKRTATMLSQHQRNHNDIRKSKPTHGCCIRAKNSTRHNDTESSNVRSSRQDTVNSALKSNSSKSTFKLPHSRSNQGFDPAILTQVKNVMQDNIRENQSKEILRKLIRRYKIENLIKKKN